ncbi:MAG TPA: hypothetical protein PKA56_06435 [Solirubrobacterales bacterium]|jgi:hypothetical protein|nr:hypothetical protein [Solirubrobacterales bacterium]HMU27520.1 hypothetical protein [Solirubrobacterales bacterium]HMX71374.1 hypothetical protein [Solirubrobacterales bacterium]HMY26598.1 hypothetical protein [Solirubrobacterales bacterium]HNA24192.1 hypothetical protein [Solirubrobacterales bacterium]
MGKLLAGMLLAFSMLFLTVPNAGAAEIPPTAECSKEFKKQFNLYAEKVKKDDSDPAKEQADLEFAEALYATGCITAVEPMVTPMKPKPFSEDCVNAAKDAAGFWDPKTKKLMAAFHHFRKRFRKLDRRDDRLTNRIEKLRRNGGPARRIRMLIRVRNRVDNQMFKAGRDYTRRVNPIYMPHVYETTLILEELLSRRCLDQKKDFIFKNEQKGPVGKVAFRNRILIFTSVLYLSLKVELSGSDSSASASALAVPGPAGLAGLGRSLPLP